MKLNVSNELKSRLMHAAENGSVIAKDILLEVKKNVPVEEIIRGTYNCFSTKRKRTEAGTFKKSGSCSRHATKIWAIPISRTGTIRRHPGFRRTEQIWNRLRLPSCSKPRTVPAR